MEIYKYLQDSVSKEMSLNDIVNVFEQMCQIPMDDDMILYETGTFDFTGETFFYFSLVRQFPNDEEEYIQIHIDVLYNPSEKNNEFDESVWNEDIDENIFDYIRNSKAFECVKSDEIVKIDIYMDET